MMPACAPEDLFAIFDNGHPWERFPAPFRQRMDPFVPLSFREHHKSLSKEKMMSCHTTLLDLLYANQAKIMQTTPAATIQKRLLNNRSSTGGMLFSERP